VPRTTFEPNWISAPGDTIADLLEERGISLETLADHLQRTSEETQALLEGLAELTLPIASGLEAFLGVPASFWLRREDLYRADLSRLQTDLRGTSGSEWLRQLPLKDMIDLGWLQIEPAEDALAACLRFFGTPTLDSWRTSYRDVLNGAAFRTSRAFRANPAAVAAWIRQGERATASIHCGSWDVTRFATVLPALRRLTRKKDPDTFLPELVERCAECGVAVAVVRAPAGCRASGATRFLSAGRALLLLSFRYLTDDQFWFTFFHEAGHLLLHGPRGFFIEGDRSLTTKEETEANAYAADLLVPAQHRDELLSLPAKSYDIIRFARSMGVSPGIVVGQLQHYGKLRRRQLNGLKRRYIWEA
jgi:HTH-type transcriptional regulator/antitoxin HigA